MKNIKISSIEFLSMKKLILNLQFYDPQHIVLINIKMIFFNS